MIQSPLERSLTPNSGSSQNVDLSLSALEDRRRFSSTGTLRSVCHGLLLVRLSSTIQGTKTNPLAVLDERGAKESLRAGFPTDRRPYTSNYDYEDDSDLEDDNDDDDDGDGDDILDYEPASAPQVVTEKPRANDVVFLEKPTAKSSESSDTVSVSDIESLFSESSETKDEPEPASSAHIGKVVVIEDVAFIT